MSDETIVKDIAHFSDWLRSGTTRLCVYHVGNLAASCELLPGITEDEHLAVRTLQTLRDAVWEAAVAGEVCLIQRGTGGGVFEYLAIRPAKGAVVAMSCRPVDAEATMRMEREARRRIKPKKAERAA